MDWILAVALGAVVLRLMAQIFLARLNAAEVRRHQSAIPAAFREIVDDAAYRRSINYTLEKNRFGILVDVWDAVLTVFILATGVLPWSWSVWTMTFGREAWSGGLYLVVVMMVLTLPGLPFEWWAQFRLEQRHGFNRSTVGLWITDRVKGALLGLAVGFPLVWVLLKLVGWIGSLWWLAGWGVMIAVQIVMILVYPVLILPLFNKLTPLPDGELRDRLLALASRVTFGAKRVEVMDGSKRSGHSNAFFTGLGRFRHIVLFDTLVKQLSTDELEAVLAHEIGHFKLGHIPRGLILGAISTLAAFAITGYLVTEPRFFSAFGFAEPGTAIAFLLFGILGGVVGFWLTPLTNALSRRHEFQADAYAKAQIGGPDVMIAALRKLSRENLSNLTPHPAFSAFYYSHPTLVEREAALRRG